jgi:hypothetical protein
VGDCSGCSGGKKVGNLGGSGNSLTFTGVSAPRDGTYLLTLGYVDGDSSRTLVVTVDGTPQRVPVAGSNDNDWGRAQQVTVPVRLTAGANTVVLGNPDDYAPDVDRISV